MKQDNQAARLAILAVLRRGEKVTLTGDEVRYQLGVLAVVTRGTRVITAIRCARR